MLHHLIKSILNLLLKFKIILLILFSMSSFQRIIGYLCPFFVYFCLFFKQFLSLVHYSSNFFLNSHFIYFLTFFKIVLQKSLFNSKFKTIQNPKFNIHNCYTLHTSYFALLTPLIVARSMSRIFFLILCEEFFLSLFSAYLPL